MTTEATTTRSFYDATPEHLAKLSGPWCCSYSGGKDSTSLVTWIEWLRRTGQIDPANPQLVQCDTLVEYPVLDAVSHELVAILRAGGWECAIVQPRISEKLYNRILGVGLTPVHPGGRRMRWCTQATKIGPMDRWRAENAGDGLVVTGLRFSESVIRAGKLMKRGCSAGGECGIPEPGDRTYSPLLKWKTCQVFDWLSGGVRVDIRKVMADVFKVTAKLVEVYNVEVVNEAFEFGDPDIKMARFGCIGCPAISSTRDAPRSVIARHGAESPLNELYDVWFEARRRDNRCVNPCSRDGRGPIRMEARKQLFDRVMDIQRRAGVVLITPEDEAFIRQCWADKVYPRGWSEADELVKAPTSDLFAGKDAAAHA